MRPSVVPPPSKVVRRSSYDILPLFEFTNVVNSSLDLNFILDTVLLTVMGKMLVSRGLVLLRKDARLFEVIAKKGLDQIAVGQQLKIDKPLRSVGSVQKLKSKKLPWISFFAELGQELVIPVFSQRKVVGYIAIGSRLSKARYSTSDKRLIQSLVNLSGAAIEKGLIIEQLKEVNRSLDHKYQELNTLFDLSKEFNVGLDVTKVVRLITFALLGQVRDLSEK